ncbi:MAG: VOC family protein [Pseudomonadota bacterium]
MADVSPEDMMVKALGVGGVFFRSKDPAALAAWYQKHLGIDPAPTAPGMMPWLTEAGVTVFSPFPADSDYFSEDQAFMLNFRVASLDAALSELEEAGITISHRQDMDGVGRFARIHDPEGNPIELWEPVQVSEHP